MYEIGGYQVFVKKSKTREANTLKTGCNVSACIVKSLYKEYPVKQRYFIVFFLKSEIPTLQDQTK